MARKKIEPPTWFKAENYKDTKLKKQSLLDWLIQFEIRLYVRQKFRKEAVKVEFANRILGSQSSLLNRILQTCSQKQKDKERKAVELEIQKQKLRHQQKREAVIELIEGCGLVDPRKVLEIASEDDYGIFWLKRLLNKKQNQAERDGINDLTFMQLEAAKDLLEKQCHDECKNEPEMNILALRLNKRLDLIKKHGLISVPLELPDNVLVKQFKEWLKTKRKQIKPLYQRKRVDWATCFLLPIMDIKHWVERNNFHWQDSEIIRIASNNRLDREIFEKTTKPWLEKIFDSRFLSALKKDILS